MKKLNNKSFFMILIGLAVGVISNILSIVLYDDDATRKQLVDMDVLSPEQIDSILKFAFGFTIFVLVLTLLVYAYFIYRLVTNRKVEQKQGYITFLFVVSIIGAVFNVMSLALADPTVIISLAINALIIVGCVIQKKYVPPIEPDQSPVINVLTDDVQNNDVFRDN